MEQDLNMIENWPCSLRKARLMVGNGFQRNHSGVLVPLPDVYAMHKSGFFTKVTFIRVVATEKKKGKEKKNKSQTWLTMAGKRSWVSPGRIALISNSVPWTQHLGEIFKQMWCSRIMKYYSAKPNKTKQAVERCNNFKGSQRQ